MWRVPLLRQHLERNTGMVKIRLCSVATKTLPAGLTYQLCKWLDRHNYSWEFKNCKFYGVPYETDERIFQEGVELFMNKISNVKPREYQVDTVYHALKEYRKTIVSPTGSGKSLMIYSIARYLKSIDKSVNYRRAIEVSGRTDV